MKQFLPRVALAPNILQSREQLLRLMILAVFSFCAVSSKGQFRQVHVEADEYNSINKVSFYSPSQGYVAFSQFIGFTTDSGRTYTPKPITDTNVDYNGYTVNSIFGFYISGVKAFNEDTIIVYGDYALMPSILYSTDKGNSFKLVHHDQLDPFAYKTGIMDMIFPNNDNIGYAVDADRIYKTTDKGLTWAVEKTDPDRYFGFLEAVDNNNVFAFSTQYGITKLYSTNDGGANWTDLPQPLGQMTYAHFISPTKGWMAMEDVNLNGVFYYTSDGGFTWTRISEPQAHSFFTFKFRFVNDSVGYAKAGDFAIYKTTDSGKVWEPLPRDNDFSYFGNSHNDMQILDQNQIWAGGAHGFMELTTNGGGTRLPKAYFKADTNGVTATGIVQLINHSKPNYQYWWYVNGTLISTSYHTNYAHDIMSPEDTVMLVVSNGVYNDTAVKYLNFNPTVYIESVTPITGQDGTTVTILGIGFTNTIAVNFGGVPAGSFMVVSDNEIQAIVGGGASGNVEVNTTDGTAIFGGFTYFAVPALNLPVVIANVNLCKSEAAVITIESTQADVSYSLVDGIGNVYGTVSGTGGDVNLVTDPLSAGGKFLLRATTVGSNFYHLFSDTITLYVEATKAAFQANVLNMTTGEKVSFTNLSEEATTFTWTFHQDASVSTSGSQHVTDVTYGSAGQKTLTLVSESTNGCRDTLVSNAVFVYAKPIPDDTCFVNQLDSTHTNGMSLGQVAKGASDEMYVIGTTNDGGNLRSRIGVAKEFGDGQQAFFAKYTTDGVLKWVHQFKGGGRFTAVQTDAAGNIYLAGNVPSNEWYYFNNGDSMQIYVEDADTTVAGKRTHGFIMKVDSNGAMLWRTILYDHTPAGSGFTNLGASATRIAIRDHHIALIGGFHAKLSYVRNGVVQQLYDFTNTSNPIDNQNTFLVKIADDGTLKWSSHMRFLSINSYKLADISIDKNGYSYLGGTYETSLRLFDAGGVERALLLGTAGIFKGFTVKLDSTGSIKWYNDFKTGNASGHASIHALAADENGYTYVTGSMQNFDQSQKVEVTRQDGTKWTDSLGSFALYKFDSSGRRVWAVGSRYSYYGESFALHLKGNEVYAAGNISNNGVEISPFTLTSTDGLHRNLVIGQSECFIAKYDTSGKFRRVFTSGHDYTTWRVRPASLFSNAQGQFILGGNTEMYAGGSLPKLFDITLSNPISYPGDGFFLKANPNFCSAPLMADAGPDKARCTSDTVSIGSNVTGDIYSWTSSPAGFTSSLPNPVVTPVVNTTYFLTVTNDAGEIAHDTVAVSILVGPSALAGPDTLICTGAPTTVGAPAIAGYTYSWTSGPAGFVSTDANPVVSPTVNTIYYLQVTDNNGCIGRDTLSVQTHTMPSPSVNITVTNSRVCEGIKVVFTAMPQNGGSAPAYQWQVNGANMGTNSDTFGIATLDNGDRVRALLTTSNVCAVQPTDTSGEIVMQITPASVPEMILSAITTVRDGQTTRINSTIINGGNSPLFYWEDSTSTHGWQAVPGNQGAAFDYKPKATGDKLRCILTSNKPCAVPLTVTTAPLTFVINNVTGVEPELAARHGLRFYPNPVQSTLIIDSLRYTDNWQDLDITSMDGKKTYIRMTVNNRSRIDIPVSGLNAGMYVAVLRNRKGGAVYLKFIKL